MTVMPSGDYSRKRDGERAARRLVEKVGSFDLVPAEDPVEVTGNPEWSESTKRLWLVASQSEVAKHRWVGTDWAMLYDVCDWWEELPVQKRGAHAYAVRAQLLSDLGLTDKGRRGLGLVVDKSSGDTHSDLTAGELAVLKAIDDEEED